MFVSPPHSYLKALIPEARVSGGEALGSDEVMRMGSSRQDERPCQRRWETQDDSLHL